jgi:hypothetical protein
MKKLSPSQQVRIKACYILIKGCLKDCIEARNNDIILYDALVSSLRSQIFDVSFFDTGLKSVGVIELEKVIKEMKKNGMISELKKDEFKIVKEHVVNRVVIVVLLLEYLQQNPDMTIEEFTDFLYKYNVTVTVTKMEHNSLSATTGYYIKDITDYESRNIIIYNFDTIFENIKINPNLIIR